MPTLDEILGLIRPVAPQSGPPFFNPPQQRAPTQQQGAAPLSAQAQSAGPERRIAPSPTFFSTTQVNPDAGGGGLVPSLLDVINPVGESSPAGMLANAPGVARGIFEQIVGGGGVQSEPSRTVSADRESASQEAGAPQPRFATGAGSASLSSQPSQPTARQSQEGPAPTPSPTPQQNLEPARQVPPAQQEAARGQWRDWLSDPNNRAMLLTTGLALMQPVGVGQTGAGHLSRAVGLGAEAGAEQRRGQEERAAAQQEASRKERRLDLRAQREKRLSRTGGLTPFQRSRLEQSEISSFNDFVQGQIEAITDSALTGGAVPEWAQGEDGAVLSAPELERKLLGPMRDRTIEAFRRRRQTAQEAVSGAQGGGSQGGGQAVMSSQEAVQRMQQQYPEVWQAVKSGQAPQVFEGLRRMVRDPEVLDQLIQSQ